jgi:hypothetical protein
MHFDVRRVAENVRRASTEDLLDRATVYSGGMEPAALDLIRGELDRRGMTADDVIDHWERRRAVVILRADGTALRCSFCDRPAVLRARGWYRLSGVIPLFPRLFNYCDQHCPSSPADKPGSPSQP